MPNGNTKLVIRLLKPNFVSVSSKATGKVIAEEVVAKAITDIFFMFVIKRSGLTLQYNVITKIQMPKNKIVPNP